MHTYMITLLQAVVAHIAFSKSAGILHVLTTLRYMLYIYFYGLSLTTLAQNLFYRSSLFLADPRARSVRLDPAAFSRY